MARPIEKKSAIERGVVTVVAAKGLQGTTIQDIAVASDVSPGLLYRYWKNRDDLACDVYQQQLLDLLDQLAAVGQKATSHLQQLRDVVIEFLAFADREPERLKFLLFTQHDLASRVPDDHSVRHFLDRIIRPAIEDGRFRPLHPDLAVQMAIGLILQPTVGCMYGHLQPPVSRYGPEILAALERLLLPAGDGDDAPARTRSRPRTSETPIH